MATGDEDGVRDRMIRSAIVQLAKHGLQGASFAEILAHARAPRGSVYYHFPGGKSELIAAALDHMAMNGLAALDAIPLRSVDDVIDSFIALWRSVLQRSDFAAGCSITGVTVTSESDEQLGQAAAVFTAWQQRLAQLLTMAELPEPGATGFATMMLASTEGAVVLARAARSLEPLDAVARQLHTLARALTSDEGDALAQD